jgi:hypothetical protein
MTYDVADGYVLLFGGTNMNGTAVYGDTWYYEGGSWKEVCTSCGPSARNTTAMAYDPNDDYVLLFGGQGCGKTCGDTWDYRSGSWSRICSSCSPSPREGAAMVYDTSDDYDLMIGDVEQGGSYLDMWSYKGGTWSEVCVSCSPGSNAYGEMTYDLITGHVLYYDGTTASTWSYSGGVWSEICSSCTPGQRNSTVLTFDPADGFALLFGGLNKSLSPPEGNLNDSWAAVTPMVVGMATPANPAIDVSQTIPLTANVTGGLGPYAYDWYSGAGCSGSTIGTASEYTVDPHTTSTTTYSYRVTDREDPAATECSPADNVTANDPLGAGGFNPSSDSIDSGQSITLKTYAMGGTPPLYFVWHYSATGTGSCSTWLTLGTTFGPQDTVNPTSSMSYCYLLTDSSSAGPMGSYSLSVSVTVFPALGTDLITPSAPAIDSGQTVLLTASAYGGSGSLSYQWYDGPTCTNPIGNATSASYSASPLSNTTYYYKVTDTEVTAGATPSGVCSAGDTVTVNGALGAGPIAPSPARIDQGQHVNLVASPVNGTSPYSFQWYEATSAGQCSVGDTKIPGATMANYTAQPMADTYFCYILWDGSSATPVSNATSTTDLVTVNSALVVDPITPGPSSIDDGQMVVLTAHVSGGTIPYSYQWYSGAGCDTPIPGANMPTYYASPLSTTAYFYGVIDSSVGTPGGSTCSTGVTLTVYPALHAGPISPSAPSMDSGQQIILASNLSGGNAPYFYQWYTGADCTDPIAGAASVDYTASPMVTTTYYYGANDSTTYPLPKCSAGVTVTVSPALVVGSFTPTLPVIDLGQSIVLAANVSGGTAPYVYQWFSGVGCSVSIPDATGPTYTVNPASNATYSYRVTDSAYAGISICSGAGVVTVNPALSAGAIGPASPTIDVGQIAVLTTNVAGGTIPYSYQWYTGAACTNIIPGATSSTYDASPIVTTTYSYKVTDGSAGNPSGACSQGDKAVVNAKIAAGDITPSSPFISSDQSVTLTANPTGGTLPYRYQWFTGAACTGPIAGAVGTKYVAAPTVATTYYYGVTDSSSAGASSQCSAGDTVYLTMLSSVSISPSSASLYVGGTYSFTAIPTCVNGACPSTGIVYTWTLDNTLGSLTTSNGSITTFAAGQSAGVVTVKVTAQLGNVTSSASVTVTITPTSAHNTNTSGPFGLSGDTGYVVLIGITVVVTSAVVASLMYLLMRGRGKKAKDPTKPAETEDSTAELQEQKDS